MNDHAGNERQGNQSTNHYEIGRCSGPAQPQITSLLSWSVGTTLGHVSTLGAVLRILGKISRVRYASTVIASVTPILVEVELPGNVIDLEMVTR